jgi:hypothetical protein
MPLLLAALIVSFPALPAGITGKHRGEKIMEEKTIVQVLKEHTPELMSIPGVVGTAEGRYKGKPSVEVYVVRLTPELRKRIPATLDGYTVRVKQTGEVEKLPEKPAK